MGLGTVRASRAKAKGVPVVVYEPTLDAPAFFDSEVAHDPGCSRASATRSSPTAGCVDSVDVSEAIRPVASSIATMTPVVPTALISRKRCDCSIIFIAMTRCFVALFEHEGRIPGIVASCAAAMERCPIDLV